MCIYSFKIVTIPLLTIKLLKDHENYFIVLFVPPKDLQSEYSILKLFEKLFSLCAYVTILIHS